MFGLAKQELKIFKKLHTPIKIQDFLDNDDKVFLLKGYAGSGKTTLLLGLVRYLKSESRPFQLMAPTDRRKNQSSV